jgi:UDP-glucose:(heptosyl)LPS alpha-1,3-glucosyltransferase
VKIAFCYESVLPARGGCETYIADLARRLAAERHEVHLFACRWDPAALPASLQYHPLSVPRGPRFLRPWLFGAACRRALHDFPELVSIGFDKTWGLDILYPLGGLHAASAAHNLRKHRRPWMRELARLVKAADPAHHAFSRLERRQYLGPERPLVVANSRMVQQHFHKYYGIPPEAVRVVHSAIDPGRFIEDDRPARRHSCREQWRLGPNETVAAFVAMNYRLKGLEPLLHALRWVPSDRPFRLLVAGSPRTGRWERLARRLGVAERVRFIGYCADTRNAYFAADFLVHPTFYDPCSLVALEALACGLPVITTRCNGASELFRAPAEGYVVDDPHDGVRLGWAIAQLLDPKRRLVAGQAARRRAARWTFDDHYRLMVEVFAEAGRRKRRAASPGPRLPPVAWNSQ